MPHGIATTPATQFIVDIPDGVKGTKPMAKSGWRIDIVRARLAKPCDDDGQQVTGDVSQIRFSGGSLSDAFYDESALLATPAAVLDVTPAGHSAHPH